MMVVQSILLATGLLSWAAWGLTWNGVAPGWWLLAVFASSLIVYPALVLRRYVRMIVKLIDECAPLPSADGRQAERLPGEEVEFPAADGHLLTGTILTGNPDRAKQGMILFAHEFGSDRTSCLRFCGPLLDEGFDVLTFDFRGHGSSSPGGGYRPRQWASDREVSDMRGALAFAETYLISQGRKVALGVFGVSRGGSAALLGAAGNPSVRCIAVDGAFSTDTTLEHLMRRFATTFARIRIVAENHPAAFWRFLRWLLYREYLKRFRCQFPSVRAAVTRLPHTPILFIHGERDSYIPVAQSQALYEAARGSRQLWIVPAARHNQSVIMRPDEYAARLVAFFGDYLNPAAPARTGGGIERHHRSPRVAGASDRARRDHLVGAKSGRASLG